MMQFAGQGTTLYLSSNNPPLEPEWTASGATVAIPDGEYSVPLATNAAMGMNIQVVYDSAPGADTEIEYDTDPEFGTAIVLDTIPSGADLVAVWTTNVTLPGFVRISNTSGVTINKVTANYIVSTSWS